MASILDKYGIKEVADVVFYELDSKGAPSAPVLYLDTLKVSTIEQSAEVVDTTGGKGNVKLISWDTNKEVTATFEDALFSVKSLAIMFGGKVTDNDDEQEVLKTVSKDMAKSAKITADDDAWEINVGKHDIKILKTKALHYKYDGEEVVACDDDKDNADFITFDLLDSNTSVDGLTITIDASTFGGTYYITGDTYAKNYLSGRDEYLQFIRRSRAQSRKYVGIHLFFHAAYPCHAAAKCRKMDPARAFYYVDIFRPRISGICILFPQRIRSARYPDHRGIVKKRKHLF